ncbi:hypothetical protein K7432_016053 [Basidiobolus ranarum]|uniref:Dynamin N-terminal domain-containing protein n=1 Tax=Basidiobolus ranarum TaxID=34480 RepID=A0ABR2WFA3_9FUNG
MVPGVDSIIQIGKIAFDKIQENKNNAQVSEYLLECREKAVENDMKRRINILREEFNRGEINSTLALCKLTMLSNENPVQEANLVNNVQQFYSTNTAYYNVFKDNILNEFFLDKDEAYMFNNGHNINCYVNYCLESSIDPVTMANMKINRDEIKEYDTEELIRLICTVRDTIKSTDFNKDLSAVNNYIEQLKQSEFTVSLFGEVNSGKSTIINTIIDLNLAFTNVETCTAVPVIYENDCAQNEPVLHLGEHFHAYGLGAMYEGEEISAVLKKLNDIVRENSIKLSFVQWPVVKVSFNGINSKIRIIDTPGISEKDPTLLQYAKLALTHSVCMMVIFPCDKINTTSENAIKAYTDSVINKGKHLCLIANRWDEYERGLDPTEKRIKREELTKRFKHKGYSKVFITTGSNAFHTSQMQKILQSGQKPAWREARIWVDKCLSNAVTTSEDLEEEYEGYSTNELQRKLTRILTNSGVSELVTYLDTGLSKDIQQETIMYICNNMIKELSFFESLRGPIRDSGIMSISDAEQQLNMNNNSKILLNKSLDRWKSHIASQKCRLMELVTPEIKDMNTTLKQVLYSRYEAIKSEIESAQMKGYKAAAKESISKSNQRDIIFFKDKENEVINQIFRKIDDALFATVRFKIKSINESLVNTLYTLKTELRDSCEDWNIVSFIDEVRIHDYIFDEKNVKKVTNIAVYKVNVERPMILRVFGSKERESRDRLCIKEVNFRCSIDAIVDDLINKFDCNIRLHICRHIESYTSYIERGSNGILDAIDTNIRKFQNDKTEALESLGLRIRSDLKLNSCNRILGKIRRKYLDGIDRSH